jgi:hypothetical protein
MTAKIGTVDIAYQKRTKICKVINRKRNVRRGKRKNISFIYRVNNFIDKNHFCCIM